MTSTVTDNLAEAVRKELENLRYLFNEEDEHQFYMEAHASYDDSLDYSTIARIVESEDPETEFYTVLDEAWTYAVEDEYDYVVKEIESRMEKDGFDTDAMDDEIREQVREQLTINAPYSHYLKQMVRVNVIMDTGDGNYDYTLNAQYPGTAYNAVRPPQEGEEGYEPYDRENFISDKASIAWLASTQGYSRTQLHEALMNDDLLTAEKRRGGKLTFLESMRQEMENCGTSMPCVCFLVKMTLEDLLRLNALIRLQDRNGVFYDATKKPDCGTFRIGKDTATGLFDGWDGGGSLFEIDLEKDIDIPIRFIRSATPDVNNCQGIRWSVGDVYGMCESQWKDTAGKITDPEA